MTFGQACERLQHVPKSGLEKRIEQQPSALGLNNAFSASRDFQSRLALFVNVDELRDLIRSVFLGGDDTFPLAADLDLVANGICDSFALLEMAMAIEQRKGLIIPDSDVTVENFGSIDRIRAYLESRTH